MTKHHTWVLVAGTGHRSGVPADVCLAAKAVGAAIARFDCGLVTGGWAGVDYLVAEAFATVEGKKGNRLEDRLVQVVRDDRRADFNRGRIVRTSAGPLEWLEPQAYCDAVVLIGGVGGTYGSFLGAVHKGIPRFPLGGTGGDAARAFQNMCELWDLIPNPGIAKSQFEALGMSISNERDAVALSERLLPLLLESVSHRSGRAPKTVFISYSRRDLDWLQRIRTILQPVERTGRIRCWTDVDIEAGSPWEEELRRKMSVADFAILLVSEHFLQSNFVRNVELPVLIERARAGRTRLLWLLLSPCSWAGTCLEPIQAAHDTRVPLSELQPTELQIVLVETRQKLETWTRPTSVDVEELDGVGQLAVGSDKGLLR